MRTAEERYLHDPQFHALVDMFTAALLDGAYTPDEARQALELARRRAWAQVFEKMDQSLPHGMT